MKFCSLFIIQCGCNLSLYYVNRIIINLLKVTLRAREITINIWLHWEESTNVDTYYLQFVSRNLIQSQPGINRTELIITISRSSQRQHLLFTSSTIIVFRKKVLQKLKTQIYFRRSGSARVRYNFVLKTF